VPKRSFGEIRPAERQDFDLDSGDPVIATLGSGEEWRGKDAAWRQIRLLAGDANSRMRFSLVHQYDPTVPTRRVDGPLNAHWPAITAACQKGYAAFMVVNEGGRSEGTIRQVRALYVEGRGTELPTMWHRRPDFVVLSAEAQWCAYWIVRAFPVEQFPRIQARLAEMYHVVVAPHTLSGATALAGTTLPLDETRSEEIYLVEWPRGAG
jgi:hypothetical protein